MPKGCWEDGLGAKVVLQNRKNKGVEKSQANIDVNVPVLEDLLPIIFGSSLGHSRSHLLLELVGKMDLTFDIQDGGSVAPNEE